jgi:cell division protein FtsW
MTHLLWTVIFAVPSITFLILTKSYRLNRILIFLNPWHDPHGKGFQIIQSLIAIGNGSMWGLGIGNSRQKFFYLPMQQTDFIFPIIAEEIGFVGSLLLIISFVCLSYFGLKIVSKLQDPFAFFTSLSFITLISLQVIINLMVSSGLLPTKGMGLPFISYGGSALLSLFCMIGFIINAARNCCFSSASQLKTS